jgi:hypothetical protein
MTNIQIVNQASKLMSKWESEGQQGSFMGFYSSSTSNDISSQEYGLVYEMVMLGMI